jgi:nucleotide-binding universal stress UspA family protein
VTGAGGDGTLRLLAIVDLSRPDADRVVENALSLAARLHAELSLFSVVARRLYERGVRYTWPGCSFGRTYPDTDIHRVVMPGPPAEALAVYADKIRADVLVIPAEYKSRCWFRHRPLAQAVAGLTSRCLWIVPATGSDRSFDAPLRIGCLMRLGGSDERLCMAAQPILEKCGGNVVLLHEAQRPGRRAREELTAAAVERNLVLIVAGRSTFGDGGADRRDILSLANRLPCHVLSVPFFSVSTPTSIVVPKSTARA